MARTRTLWNLLSLIGAASLILLTACGDGDSTGAGTSAFTGDDGVSASMGGTSAGGDTSGADAGGAGEPDAPENGADAAEASDAGGDDAEVVADAAEDAADAVDPDAEADAAEADAEVEEACPEGWAEVMAEAAEIEPGRPFMEPMPTCQVGQRFMVLAREMELTLSLNELPAGAVVEIAAATGDVLMSELADEQGRVEMAFSPPTSGEWRVLVRRVTGLEEGAWSGALTCQAGCDREATRYPIVLLHGMVGTDVYFGILEYWYQVPGHLEGFGYDVHVTVSNFIGHSETRAPQIAEQIDAILEETGASKVHLIGHSQGGLDMRVLVSGLGYGDRVASMTTVATPHKGIKIEVPEFLTGMNFGESYMTGEFVETYPDVESIPRFSWAGRSCRITDLGCLDETGGEIVSPVFSLTYRAIGLAHIGDEFGGANDGVVPIASAVWGEFLGALPADHMDEVGQIADQRSGPFDHLEFYLSEARRLREVERR